MSDDSGGWPDTMAALIASLKDEGLPSDMISALVADARPALMLAAIPTDENAIPPGATRIGGRPDLPPGVPWPERPAYANAAAMAKEIMQVSTRYHLQAGIIPPGMARAEGDALLEAERRRSEDNRAFMRTLGIEEADIDAAFSAIGQITPSASHDMTKADAAATAFPLPFLAQVDLAALSAEPGFDPALPRSGRLLFFYDLLLMPAPYDPHSAPALRVIHDDADVTALVRAEMPATLAAVRGIEDVELPASRVVAASVVTVPAEVGG